MTGPVATWGQTPPNLLPVDLSTGGQAVLAGWINDASGLSLPAGIVPNTALTIPSNGAWSSRLPAGLVGSDALVVTPGLPYRYSVTSTSALVVFAYAVRTDDTYVDPPVVSWSPPGRATVEAVVPGGVDEIAIRMFNPSTYTGPDADGVVWADALDAFGATVQVATPLSAPGDAPLAGPGTLSDPVLVQGTYDPGPTPPTPSDDTFGRLVWEFLPEMYRRLDAQQSPAYPLLRYLQGAGVGSDAVLATAKQIYTGDLTDPDAIPDRWLPWLVAVLGVISSGTPADNRASAAARIESYQPSGTAANLEAYVQQYLTGSKSVTVGPSGTAWVLRVTVIDAETTASGGTAAMMDRLRKSGKLPAGWDVNVDIQHPAWDAVDTRFGASWSPTDEDIDNWADLDSTGLGAP